MDLTTAQQMLEGYLAAERAVLQGKSVTFEGRSYSKENLAEIRAGRMEWERRVKQLSSGGQGIRSRRVIPLDI